MYPLLVVCYLVMLPEALTVADGEECYAQLPALAIHGVLHINAHSACALVKYGKLWLVVEHAGHLKDTRLKARNNPCCNYFHYSSFAMPNSI